MFSGFNLPPHNLVGIMRLLDIDNYFTGNNVLRVEIFAKTEKTSNIYKIYITNMEIIVYFSVVIGIEDLILL